MKILIDSYNLITQYGSGGIQVRLKKFYKEIGKKENIEIKLFDKWNDKISDFDILHIFKVTTENYAMIEFAKKNNVKIVISSIVQKRSKRKTKISNLLAKIHIYTSDYFINRGLNLSDAIIAQTEEEKNFLFENYKIDKKKIFVIPNPLDASILEGNKKLIIEKYKLPENFVLQVGRIEKNKNQLNVIKALKDTNIPLVLIGGPEINQNDYFEQCKKEATDNIYFLGWIEHNDPLLASAYSNAKVVILPSCKETFGNVLLEGGSAGANLVVSKTIPISKEKIFDRILKIEPDNIEQIKQTIEKAYKEPKDEEFRKELVEKFSINSIINSHIKIYNNLI